MSDQKYIDVIREAWNLVKNSFDQLSESTVNLWFGEIEVLSFDEKEKLICLGIPSEFKFKIVNEQYLSSIREKFCGVLGFDVKVNLSLSGGITAEEEKPKNSPIPGLADYNFEYTFDNFIVGSTNKFAHAACLSVANNPATNYNPLFIYGNSGLGKTHLLCATLNQMKKNNPGIKIIYTKGEDFTNEMIACLASKSMDEFREKFRNCDVLLIDDIQFIAGKISIQEEFFHTFDALYSQKKQIILTSDRPPRDIEKLEDRLQTRFEWGLLADIEPPDLELRIAIIKKKAEQVNIEIPDEVLTFLAENLRSNIRQLEGAIKKLGAIGFLFGKEINMEVAKGCIAELLGGAEPVTVTVDKIFATIEKNYGITKEEILGEKRSKEIVNARQISAYLIRNITEMSLPNIAKIYGKDHATILYSINQVEKKIRMDAIFEQEVKNLKKEVAGN